MKRTMNIFVLLAMIVNVMVVFADTASDDDRAAKGKREAPMAEPSTDYTPPRIEAPYATYSPLVASASYYQPTTFNQGPSSPFSQGPSTTAAPYEYNRYTGVIPLPPVDGNELGNGHNPGPPYNQAYGLTPPAFNGNNAGRSAFGNSHGYRSNNGFGNNNDYNIGNEYGGSHGSFPKFGQSSQGQFATSYAQLNGLSPSLTVYGGNSNGNNNGNDNTGFYAGQQPSDNKGAFREASPFNNHGPFNNQGPFNNPGPSNYNPGPSNYNSGPSNYENPFYGNPPSDNKYPSTAALVSNEPRYIPDAKGLPKHPQKVSSLNTQVPKNSRPVALTPPHLQRKPPPLLNDTKNPNFRPSFLLGSSVLSSTPDYDEPTLTSLGTLNPYFTQQQNIQLIPVEQYSPSHSLESLPLSQRDYLPAPQPQFLNGYQSSDNFGGQPQAPVTSYGDALPETIIYTKSSLYGERYGPSI